MSDYIQISLNLFSQSIDRIIWNLFLAFIPLIISYYIFESTAVRNVVWWVLLIIFIAFLPNSPYILTDAIHIIELSQKDYPLWAIILILIPQYTLFIGAGFAAYARSLINLDNYLINIVNKQYVIFTNAIAHLLCVVGIYLGRFERFNSWDLITQPRTVIITTVADLLDLGKLLSVAIAFLLIWLLSELTKLVNKSYVARNSRYS